MPIKLERHKRAGSLPHGEVLLQLARGVKRGFVSAWRKKQLFVGIAGVPKRERRLPKLCSDGGGAQPERTQLLAAHRPAGVSKWIRSCERTSHAASCPSSECIALPFHAAAPARASAFASTRDALRSGHAFERERKRQWRSTCRAEGFASRRSRLVPFNGSGRMPITGAHASSARTHKRITRIKLERH